MSHASIRSVPVGFSRDIVPAGTHICYLFGDDDERHDVLARFLAAGRHASDRMLVLVETESLADLAQELLARGVAPGDDVRVTPAHDYYYDDDTFGSQRMLDRIGEFFEDSRRLGFAGARASGEMSWALRQLPGTEHVMEYEARLNDLLRRYPTTCVCQYDMRLFGGAAIMDVLSVHPYTLVRGQLIKNPFFIEPARFLERYSAARS